LDIRRIVLLGAGRVASQLGPALKRSGITVEQVFDRTPSRGAALARRLQCPVVSDPREIVPDADLYLMAVSDDAIPALAASLALPGKLVVHTSGTIGRDALAPASERNGIFYPLQTFPAGKRVNFSRVPVCIEAGDPDSEESLAALAGKISSRVLRLDEPGRRLIHLAAVFSANFSNFMYTVAEDLLVENGIPFGYLNPLIEATARNSRGKDLIRSQTGPAARNDRDVIDHQRELLRNQPDYLALYDLITENILKFKTLHEKL